MEKREPSYTISGNINWYSQYGKQYRGSLKKKKLKLELPCDWETSLLGTYAEKTLIWKYAPQFSEDLELAEKHYCI